MMRRYAKVAGLTPRMIVPVPVPLLTPRLSSLWVGLVTPVPASLAMPLVESLRNEVVCSEHDIAGYIPDPPGGLLPLDQAIALALRHTRERAVSTRWSSAARPARPATPCRPTRRGPAALYVDARNSVVHASPAALWRVIEGIGGETGWYSFPAAWAVRGLPAGSPAGPDCAAAAVTPAICSLATPWISGGSRRSSREHCCGCAGDETARPGLAGAVGGPGL